MEITWQGNTTFTIKGQSAQIVTDPQTKDIKADIILSGSPIAEAPKEAKVFDWPGEYETREVPINGFSAFTKPKKEDGTSDGDKTIIFRFTVDGVTICHLGELGHTLKSELIERIGNIDVLMIKLGQNSNLDKKKALEIIESIEPCIVIPMGDSSMESALSELGIQSPTPEPKLTIKSASSLQTEDLRYIVLQPST